jgi:release factor glutamine methyltransferase
MMLERPTTWGELLQAARRTLSPPSFAPFEAEELLARAAGRPRHWFLSRGRDQAPGADAKAFLSLVTRRASGEPLQYLLGEWEFHGRTFRVDPRALIPRGETEGIIDVARSAAPFAHRVLDAGTGSGILAVTVALEWPNATVTALDRSVAALALARENARTLGALERIAFVGSDWLSALGAGRGIERFDLVVANPPYVPLEDAPHLDKTVSDHEPGLAIFGGADGLDPLRILLSSLPPLLRTGAPFIFEFGYAQASLVSDLVEASGTFRLSAIRLDAAGIPRTATAIRTAAGSA